jgi:hypothetical protein
MPIRWLKRAVKWRLIQNVARPLTKRLGLEIIDVHKRYAQDGLFTVHNDSFRAEPAFREAYARGVKASAGFDPEFEWRVHVALWAAQTALEAEGDFVECGVNAGFMSSAMMESLDWNRTGRKFFLIDTFAGPVLDQYSSEEVAQDRRRIAEEVISNGGYVTDVERIRANFAEWPCAIVVQGAVPRVLDEVTFGNVAFLHIDMNCALPERAALEFFWEKLSPGAVVLFDDFAYAGYEAQRAALAEVARARGHEILSVPTGQGLLIKRG